MVWCGSSSTRVLIFVIIAVLSVLLLRVQYSSIKGVHTVLEYTPPLRILNIRQNSEDNRNLGHGVISGSVDTHRPVSAAGTDVSSADEEVKSTYQEHVINNKHCDGFRFAGYYSDHMVLQRHPWRAVVWGYTAPSIGHQVVLNMAGKLYSSAIEKGPDGQTTWHVTLEPEKQPGPFSIQATSGECAVTLKDVLFGDVWLCAGQSNMKYQLHKIDNAESDIGEAPRFSKIRIMDTPHVIHKVPQHDISANWSLPAVESVQNFSALCWLYGKGLHQKLGVPIGLVGGYVGGTRIQAWSSARALQNCFQHHAMDPPINLANTPSVLWNGMINPLTRMSIYGAIWYQGEENRYGVDTDLYACALSSLLADWRLTWHQNTRGATDPMFPFGQVQLAGWKEPWVHDSNVSEVRWLQTAGKGYTPNQLLPRVFTAVAVDLPDPDAPYHAIHPRYKRQIATRLLYGAYPVAYGLTDTGPFQGPIPTSHTVHTQTINVTYDNGTAHLEIRDVNGFDVCCSDTNLHSPCQTADEWIQSTIVRYGRSWVSISNPCRLNNTVPFGMRYAWGQQPCSFEKCAIYRVQHQLPAPPYQLIF